MNECNILVCSTGSVATIKVPLLIKSLVKESTSLCKVNVKYCLTEKAAHFCSKYEVNVESYSDSDEWAMWKKRGDPVLHIELSKWADILVIAPLDANTLAKISNGICDNLLLCVVRAWDSNKPLVFCPAMNTNMWNHPVTSTHINILKSWRYLCLPPISKLLMCGDSGVGAMIEVSNIVSFVIELIPESLRIRETLQEKQNDLLQSHSAK